MIQIWNWIIFLIEFILQIAAVEGIKRFSGNPSFKFFYGMALVMEGRVQEGIRELDPLQGYSEVCTEAKNLYGFWIGYKMTKIFDCNFDNLMNKLVLGYAGLSAGISSCA